MVKYESIPRDKKGKPLKNASKMPKLFKKMMLEDVNLGNLNMYYSNDEINAQLA